MKYLSIIVVFFLLFNCNNENSKTENLSATEIIDQSIRISGGEKFKNSRISFDFRDKHYQAQRILGQFHLERKFKDSTGYIKDVLGNNGFSRTVDGDTVVLSKSKLKTYTASVNSVHYFSTLPYGLNDRAVNKKLLGEENIKERDYYKIEVTFSQEGGGEDYEDVFIYWIHKETFKPDYLAYSYNEDDGKGMRFREAYNERYVNGLRFVDYNNYNSEKLDTDLKNLAKLFNTNQLNLVSIIELKNIEVELVNL